MSSRKKRRVEDSEDESQSRSDDSDSPKKQKGKRKQVSSDSESEDWDDKPKRKQPAKKPEIAFTSSESSSSDDASASSSESSGEEEANDDIYEDEEDRKRVMALNERDREAEIFRRQEEMERRKERARLTRDIKRRQKEESRRAKQEKTKGSKESKKDKKEAAAKERRQKEEEREREREIEKEREEEKERERRKAKESYVYSDEESDRESSSSEDEKREEKEEEVTVKDLNKIRLSRHKLEAWYDQPYFEDTVRGCFVRMNIGVFDGQPVYRMVEITDAIKTNSRTYVIKGKGTCNKILQVRFGKNAKQFAIKYASNSEFKESEFQKWKEAMKKADLPLPRQSHIKDRVEAIQKAINYEYTNEDIERMIKEKKEARKHRGPELVGRNFAAEKTQLTLEIEKLRAEDDHEAADELAKKLAEVENEAKEWHNHKAGKLSMLDNINKRARRTNQAATRKDELLWEKPGEGEMYERRKCQPFMVITKPPTKEQQKEAEDERKRDLAEKKTRAEMERKQDEAERMRRKSIDANDVIRLHDFDVGLDIDLTKLPQVPQQQLPVVAANQGPGLLVNGVGVTSKRAMRLAEYKRQKGLL